MQGARRKIWLFLGLGHLIVAGLGAVDYDFSTWGTLGEVLRYYAAASGADTGYFFFKLGVRTQSRLRFEIVDACGKASPVSLASPLNQEAALWFSSILDNAIASDDTPKGDIKRALFASFAGKVFGRHPEARKVIVHLENFEPKSLAEFRRGLRPEWKEIYQVTYGYTTSAER